MRRLCFLPLMLFWFIWQITACSASSATVIGTNLKLITITPINPVIHVGAPQQFIATGIYLDNSKKNITARFSILTYQYIVEVKD